MAVPDVSTFDARWSVAVSYLQYFATLGGEVGGVVQRYSKQCRLLRDSLASLVAAANTNRFCDPRIGHCLC
jgi:hypothetical protein